jgi:hypothetical protein
VIIYAHDVVRTDGTYGPQSVRLAIWDAIASLRPHQSFRNDGVCDAQGEDVPGKKVQINVAQIAPNGWKYFAKRDGEAVAVCRRS